MILPYAENLSIEFLSRVFDRNRISNCYKYFWFMAILEKISEEKTEFSYDELITEMIVIAWYMVAEYHLRLGPNNTVDNVEEVVKYLFEELYHKQVPSTVKKDVLRNLLLNETDKRFLKYKDTLTNNVPYCLQSPFYNPNNKLLKNPNKNIIPELNQEKRLMYYFREYQRLNTKIIIEDDWAGYLIKNREILMDWTRYNLIGYLQDRNPSVPGISDKILPPYARDLKRVKKYWDVVIKADPSLKDIYEGTKLSDIPISIDHFIPWQYVAHDELWNLSPTTKSVNSRKGNNLPSWDRYFEELLELEYKAYRLRYAKEAVAKEFEKCAEYHLNNTEIKNTLYADHLSKTDFGTRLFNVVRPVYDSAKNCGFREWNLTV